MQIYCPKCKTGYEIDASVVPEKGRKLRCAVCGKVFKCLPEDLVDGSKLRTAEFTEEEKARLDEQGYLQEEIKVSEVQEANDGSEKADTSTTQENKIDSENTNTSETQEDNNNPEDINNPDKQENEETEETESKSLDDLENESQDVKDIFQRLSVETAALFKAESEEKPVKKYWFNIKKSMGLQNPRNIKYYLLVMIFMILSVLYHTRYDVVRAVPAMATIYKALGIKAIVIGEGLDFQNVTRRDFEDDFVRKFEIKGFIANKTTKKIEIPLIKAELLDKETRTIQSATAKSTIPVVVPQGKVPFSFIIEKPSPLTKYIYLTFIETEKK